jgi:hypothetical protein
MTTDKLLDAWKRWIERGSTLPVAMRDTENAKSYPGVYIEGDSVSRFESGGVQDGNVFSVEWETKLVTTPGDDAQTATSKSAHDAYRNIIAAQVGSSEAESWMDSQLGIRVFQLLVNSPETTEEDGYRVTTWKASAISCPI